MSTFLIFFVALVALVAAGEEPLQPQGLEGHHHVTTVCIQVHGKSPLCGPMVNPEAQPESRASHNQFEGGPELRSAQMANEDAYLEGFFNNAPVFRLRSAAEKSQLQNLKNPQEPCDTSARSAGSVTTVVQPGNAYGLGNPGLAGLGAFQPIGGTPNVVIQQQPLPGLYRSAPAPPGPAGRTIPFAPFGAEPNFQDQRFQGQKMRAAQFIRNMASMRSAPDCDDPQVPPPLQMRNSGFQHQQQMLRQQDYMPTSQNYLSMRDSQSAGLLAKQCAEQEIEIKKKAEEIAQLQKQIDRLVEKTTVESKTITVKEASKEQSPDPNFKESQAIKKKK